MSKKTTQNTSKAEDKALLILRPKFVPALAYIEAAIYVILGVFLLTVGLGFLFILLLSILQLGNIIPAWLPLTLVFAVSAIFLPPFFFETIMRNMKRTGYKFYDEHVLFQHYHMLFFRNRGRLKYRDIQDVIERSDILQAKHNVGTVWLLAPGTGIAAGQRFPGLKIKNVPLGDDLTDFFEALLFDKTEGSFEDAKQSAQKITAQNETTKHERTPQKTKEG